MRGLEGAYICMGDIDRSEVLDQMIILVGSVDLRNQKVEIKEGGSKMWPQLFLFIELMIIIM
jgi:hypothetical protein